MGMVSPLFNSPIKFSETDVAKKNALNTANLIHARARFIAFAEVQGTRPLSVGRATPQYLE